MVGPQLENGYTRIANELAEALAHTNLSPKQGRCIWFLLRRTYGWGKKTARITTKEWETGTGLFKQHVYTALRELIERNMVTRTSYQYGINKHYTQWREVTRTRYSNKNSLQNRSQELVTLPIKKTIKKGEVTRTRYQIPEGRVQPKGHHVEPCTECGWQPGPGYDQMVDGVCLDCRQEEVQI